MNLPHNHGNDNINMPDEESFNRVADLFRLLDDPVRLRLFWILCHMRECLINLAYMLDMSSPAISHHLKLLKSAGIVVSTRDGKEVYYKCADTPEVKHLHKSVENIMKISCPEQHKDLCENPSSKKDRLTEYEKIIEGVHEYLCANLEKRITIEELSKKFHINPTTLKDKFKDIYGTSIGAHIKEHRMEKAALLLKESDLSVYEISQNSGYLSMSKFGKAFSSFYNCSPSEYRKNIKK